MHCSPQRDDHLRTQFQRLTVAERAHALADRTDQVDITSMGFAVKVQRFDPTASMEAAGAHQNYPILFDPQTSGGLLAAIPAVEKDACVEELLRLGYADTAVIGEIRERSDHPEAILLRQ